MSERGDGLFARRGIHLPGARATLLTILGAFALGIAIGWLTTQVPGIVAAINAPAPSPSPSVEPSPEPVVSVPPLAFITRSMTDADRVAGLTSLEYPYEGEGTLSMVAGYTNPLREGIPIRYFSVEVEDGINIDGSVLADFLLDRLNDPRGWGAYNRVQYVRTDGVADVRVVIASPYTAARLCPHTHDAAPGMAVPHMSPTPSPGTSPQPVPTEERTPGTGCAERGVMMLSVYDWAAGLEAFGTDVEGARIYFLNHGIGHLRGLPDDECTAGEASVMVDHRALPEACSPNPWPHPEVEIVSDEDVSGDVIDDILDDL